MTTRTRITETAQRNHWTLAHESDAWQEWRKGSRVVSVTYTATQTVKNAAHAWNENRAGRYPTIGEIEAGVAGLSDTVDRHTSGKSQQVASWLETTSTVVELPDSLRSPMHREANRGLMVAFIHRTGAYHLDVRTSIVFYDDGGLFEHAVPENLAPLMLGASMLQRLHDETTVRYYSKGI